MPRPTTPAPMTMVFGRCDGTTRDALMTDSLHRACPARFSGSDLSRPPLPHPPACGRDRVGAYRTAPQPRPQFQAEPRGDARIFWRRPVRAQGDPPPSDRPGGLLTFSTDLAASVLSMRPFAGARPHGHPPLSLEAANGGLFFTPAIPFLYSRISPFAAPARLRHRRYRLPYRSAPVLRRSQ